jgi:hypothetical protein
MNAWIVVNKSAMVMRRYALGSTGIRPSLDRTILSRSAVIHLLVSFDFVHELQLLMLGF